MGAERPDPLPPDAELPGVGIPGGEVEDPEVLGHAVDLLGGLGQPDDLGVHVDPHHEVGSAGVGVGL